MGPWTIVRHILTVLVVIGAFAAMSLAGRMFEIRNSYLEKFAKNHAQITQNQDQILDSSLKLKNVQAELSREYLGWDRYWPSVATNVQNPGEGILNIILGTNNGLRAAGDDGAPESIYAFQPSDEGKFMYVGSFQVTTLRENQAALKPTFRLRTGETANWKAGNWRFRTLVPAGYKERFSDLEVRSLLADELLDAKLRNIEIQTQLADLAKQHLELRKGELLGNEEMKAYAGKLDIEFVEGLIAAIDLEEERRNAANVEVDRLRRNLKSAHDMLTKLIAQNKAGARDLPGAQPAPAQTANTQVGKLSSTAAQD